MREADKARPAGRYKILGAIHRGGMGQILLARQEGAEGFNRKLVLKGLLPQLIHDEVSLELFRREAQIMSRLDHPNIVRVVDFTYVEDKPYLAMEYIRGRNLHQVIQRAARFEDKLPPVYASYVVAEALRGLHCAHHARDEDGRSLGIVHRDVSPGNILLSFFGEVKVVDFGIATSADAKKYTAPKSIRGKARYAAPEVVRGKPATPQSDIHAAGVVLAEALIGEPLWERGNVAETLISIVTESRDLTVSRILSRIPGAPERLERILRSALAIEPTDRFETAEAFADELDELTREMGGASPAELGELLRKIFEGDADLPSDGGVIGPDLPALSFCEEQRTEPSIATPDPEPVTPNERAVHFASLPTVEARCRNPAVPPPPRPRSIRPQTRPPRPSSPVVRAKQPEPVSEAYYFSEMMVGRHSTWEEMSRAPSDDGALRSGRHASLQKALRSPWALLMLGILIGAVTALTGSLLALMRG